MIALSTAWFPRSDPRLVPTLEAIHRMGFEAVEIGVSDAKFRLKKVKRCLEQTPLKVVSVHNVCSESKVDGENRRGDWLASPDEAKRRKGVEATLETVRHAEALGATAVVLHLGSPPIEGWEAVGRAYLHAVFLPPQTPRVQVCTPYPSRASGPLAPSATSEPLVARAILAERDRHAPAYLDAACRSLEELLARPSSVNLGVECRMGWHEIPSLDEVGILLERFPDPRVGYWHDVGHAVILDFLGVAGQHEWLRRYGRRTLGIHLHDVRERTYDHYPPGLGQVDFKPIRELLPQGAIRVMELSANFIAEEVQMGKRRLEEMGFCS